MTRVVRTINGEPCIYAPVAVNVRKNPTSGTLEYWDHGLVYHVAVIETEMRQWWPVPIEEPPQWPNP